VYRMQQLTPPAVMGCDWAAYDFDEGVTNSIYEYNYSHDNGGAAILVYNPGGGNVFRYNVSENDDKDVGRQWRLRHRYSRRLAFHLQQYSLSQRCFQPRDAVVLYLRCAVKRRLSDWNRVGEQSLHHSSKAARRKDLPAISMSTTATKPRWGCNTGCS